MPVDINAILGQPSAADPQNWQGTANLMSFTGGSKEDPWNWTGIQNGTVPPEYAQYLNEQGHPVAQPNRPSNEATPIPATPPPPPAPQVNQTIYNSIAAMLQQYGLSSLFTVGADGQPSGWLFQQMIAGYDTADEIKIAIESTPEWKARFRVIEEQRKKAAAGQPVYVMTAEDVVNYEATAAELMRRAALPPWLYDQSTDFDNLMLSGVSTDELRQRIGESFTLVTNSPPAIRQAFDQFYGTGAGDGALAAFFLNPERTQASLDRASKAAFAAGMGSRYGMHLGQTTAEAIADKPLTAAGIDQALEQTASLAGLFQEGIGETQDLTLEGEGINSTFFGDADARRNIEARQTTRGVQNRATVGGAAQSQRGVVGVGSS